MKYLKSNKGVTMTDIVLGLLILILFTGVLTSSFYNIYRNNILIKYKTTAVDYAIKILEETDRLKYEQVTDDLNKELKEKFNIREPFKVQLEVENYNKDDEQKEDVIKILTVTVNYKVINEEQKYTVKKLKIKER